MSHTQNSSVVNIAITDDHPLFRSALKAALELSLDNINCTETSALLEVEKLLAKDNSIDLLLLDLQLPDSNGFSGLLHLKNRFPKLKIALISAHDSQDVMQSAFDNGANGFISKSEDMQTMKTAIEKILAGGTYFPKLVTKEDGGTLHTKTHLLDKVSELTSKQYEVFHHCSQGLLNKQIAYKMNVTEATVKAHITAVMRKFEINNRTQIVMIANTLKDELKTTF